MEEFGPILGFLLRMNRSTYHHKKPHWKLCKRPIVRALSHRWWNQNAKGDKSVDPMDYKVFCSKTWVIGYE